MGGLVSGGVLAVEAAGCISEQAATEASWYTLPVDCAGNLVGWVMMTRWLHDHIHSSDLRKSHKDFVKDNHGIL